MSKENKSVSAVVKKRSEFDATFEAFLAENLEHPWKFPVDE